MPIMPQQEDPYYCSQQIHVPPDLPDILKQFTKAAIRTQPKDVLAWSAAYFHAIANNEVPPAKTRLETYVATQKNDTGLTPELLRVLNRQLGPKKTMPVSLIEEKWEALSLPKEVFDDLVRIGDLTGDVQWLRFLALACSSLRNDITSSMVLLCEILTADPDGGAARVPMPMFKDLYLYLAYNDGEITMEDANTALEYLEEQAKQQHGYIQPRNFLSTHCPSLAGPHFRNSGAHPTPQRVSGGGSSSQAMGSVADSSGMRASDGPRATGASGAPRATGASGGPRATGASGAVKSGDDLKVRGSGGSGGARATGALGGAPGEDRETGLSGASMEVRVTEGAGGARGSKGSGEIRQSDASRASGGEASEGQGQRASEESRRASEERRPSNGQRASNGPQAEAGEAGPGDEVPDDRSSRTSGGN